MISRIWGAGTINMLQMYDLSQQYVWLHIDLVSEWSLTLLS